MMMVESSLSKGGTSKPENHMAARVVLECSCSPGVLIDIFQH